MHEMGIADAMMKMVDGILEKEKMEGAQSITVELGDLSGVVPRFLQSAWEAVTDGTRYEKTELRLVSLPATARCEDCGTVFPVDIDSLRCPKCGGDRLTPLSGLDMTIKEIAAY